MKPDRQNIILEIISAKEIETQKDLMDALAEKGIRSTQATLSRDMKDLHIVKKAGKNGKSYYVKQVIENKASESRLRAILKESVLHADVAQNLVVLKTLPGLASAACSAFDGMTADHIVGTLAGDDTAFIAFKDNPSAIAFCEKIQTLL